MSPLPGRRLGRYKVAMALCECRGKHRISRFQAEALRSVLEAGELALPRDLDGRARASFRTLVNHGLVERRFDGWQGRSIYSATSSAIDGDFRVEERPAAKGDVELRSVAADAPAGKRPRRKR